MDINLLSMRKQTTTCGKYLKIFLGFYAVSVFSLHMKIYTKNVINITKWHVKEK